MKTGSPLIQEALALRARYDEEPSHSDHVSMLARQIFEGLRGWHGLTARAGKLLHAAALLHDIGWSQTPDGKGHHKWSARLIREHEWKNLAGDEVLVVAQIARYHRKALPQPAHEDFHSLKASAQKRVMILGGILRLADALDRTHSGRITGVSTSAAASALIIRVSASGPWEPEREMFESKRGMLELASARSVLCEAVEGT